MFRLREHGTTVWAEIRGGLVTFLTLSYILFVQPAVLSAVGMPRNDVFVATCVCSALACFLMGVLANYPFALAPAMGHNFFFAFTVCSALGFGFLWPEALLANLIAGAIFLCLSFVGLREAIMHAVPESLKYAIAVGIGLLIAFVGLQYGGIVQNSPAVLAFTIFVKLIERDARRRVDENLERIAEDAKEMTEVYDLVRKSSPWKAGNPEKRIDSERIEP